jgi:hypothetical protein
MSMALITTLSIYFVSSPGRDKLRPELLQSIIFRFLYINILKRKGQSRKNTNNYYVIKDSSRQEKRRRV